jgi:hypothetical protein
MVKNGQHQQKDRPHTQEKFILFTVGADETEWSLNHHDIFMGVLSTSGFFL